MMLTAICFFLAGMVAGYISLRSLGWLCVLFLGVWLGRGEQIYWWLHNDTLVVQYYQVDIQIPCGGNWSSGGGGSVPVGQEVNSANQMGSATNGNVRVRWRPLGETNWGAWNEAGCHSGGVWKHFYASYTPPAAQYYISGCITNTTGYPRRVRLILSPQGGASTEIVSPDLILPMERWCWNQTNSVPTSYMFQVDTYDGEGGFIGNDIAGPYWALTNSVPATGGSGGGQLVSNPGGSSPGNLQTDEGTAGGLHSTNSLTGGQFVSVMTNVNNTMYQGFDMLGRTMANQLGRIASNSASGDMTWTNWLVGISNRTDSTATNIATWASNASWLDRMLTNQIDTNAFGSGTGYASTVIGSVSAYSNLFYQSEINIYEHIMLGTNISSVASDPALWKIPVATSLAQARAGGLLGGAGGSGGIDLNPLLSKVGANLLPWVRVLWMFLLVTMSLRYIAFEVQRHLSVVFQVPGGGPGSSETAIWTTLTPWNVTVLAVAIAGFPILLSAGVNVILGLKDNETFLPPLSEEGMARGGIYHSYLRLGLNWMKAGFPLTFAMALGGYLIWFRLFAGNLVRVAAALLRLLAN